MFGQASVIIATIVGAAVGYYLGSQYERPWFGGLAGGILGLKLGLFAITKRQRWWLFLAVAVLYFAVYQSGGWVPLVLAIGASAILLAISGGVLTPLYGADAYRSVLNHLKLMVGMVLGFQIIGDPKPTTGKPADTPQGPRTVIVRPKHVAIMVQGGRQTRIVGPSVFQSGQFEYASKVYESGPKEFTRRLSDVLTQDQRTVDVCIACAYRLRITHASGAGEAPLTKNDITVIREVDQRAPDWQTAAKSAIEESAREEFRTKPVDYWMTTEDFQSIGQAILTRATAKMGPLGFAVQFLYVYVVDIIPSAEYLQQVEAGIEALLDANNWRNAITALAGGYSTASGLEMPAEAIDRELLRRLLNTIAKDPAASIIFSVDTDLQNRLRQLLTPGGGQHDGPGPPSDAHSTK